MIEATAIDYFRTSTINVNASESSHSAMTNTPSIIDIIDDDIDCTFTKGPSNQYGSFEKSMNTVNANIEAVASCDIKQYHAINSNIEAGPSNNTKKYHTTVEDYIDDNESDNKKDIDLIYDEDLQNFEEQEELQPRKKRKPVKKATKGKQKQLKKKFL
ncbi:hypothetical protein C2G38_2041798 [Gigaspora rosea]|uniref:Uncharacterized protein n=1 Tax=Gigaspora rosea TaxID=44941 RepID=A0A397USB9_9GLOM|nr:hypothetical protein C2G38_2041798 [Gigaspora rosea]